MRSYPARPVVATDAWERLSNNDMIFPRGHHLSATVGPIVETVGVPTAAARCNTPELLQMRQSAA